MMLLVLVGCVGGHKDTVDSRPNVGVVDDTAVEPPLDADGDGYTADVDCDDSDASRHPGAAEVCNGKDDDCDDLTDDEDGDLETTSASVWHPDVDVDGFGDNGTSALACAPPQDWVADGSDCADDDGTVFPGAIETCDGIDNNCDGEIDETCAPSPTGEHSLPDFPLRITGEGPLFGAYFTGVGDVDADGSDDLIVGSQAEVDGLSGAGAVWLTRGPVTAAADLSALDPLLRGDSERQRLGNHSIGVGDVNGDGLDDFLVGTYLPQWARLYLGPASDSDGEADAVLTGVSSLYRGDRALAGLDDMDGDGFADIVMGDHTASPDSDHYSAGAAYVFRGPIHGTMTSADADAVLLGSYELCEFGFSVAGIGDVNGDGVPDLSATWLTQLGSDYSVGVYFGPFGGTRSGVDEADVVINSTDDDTTAYRASAWSPVLTGAEMDADGDGRTDLLLSGLRSGSGGTAFVFTALSGLPDLAAADTIITGDTSRSGAVQSTWAGDLNQDGNADLAMSDTDYDGRVLDGGSIYIFYGPLAPGLDATSSADAILYGDEASAEAGYVVAPGGDLTGDAYPDLLVSAPGETLGGVADGVAWIIAGGP